MKFSIRTHTCNELNEDNIGSNVVLNGWVDNRRDLGGVIFIDLRDRYGITQVVFEPTYNKNAHELGKSLRTEYVISIEGKVRKRPEGTENSAISTGAVDVMVDNLIVLNEAVTTPFQIKDDIDVSEELRLKYRYLDLRRSSMQQNLKLRHYFYQLIRKYFDAQNFLEIETPILMKSTPEGARDFLVPSRLHKGSFYALPQSPQTYKQLLMVSGFDRYFQIVKCFRDEDMRADRQPEFTQIDVEMSFVNEEEIFKVAEGLIKELFVNILNVDIVTPFPRLTYHEAMERYGTDKPDTRFGMEMKTLNNVFSKSEFRVFKDTIDNGGIITSILVKKCGDYTRNQLDQLTDYVKSIGAGGLIWMRVKEEGLEAPIAKFLSDKEKNDIIQNLNAKTGDLILIISGEKDKTLTIMGNLRLEMANRLELIDASTMDELLWVTHFPLLEWDDDTQRYYAMHHPFTAPQDEDLNLLDSSPEKVKAKAYDLVMNGNEIAGGSIRIFNSDVQSKMFNALGISNDEAVSKFGFLLEAFKFGAPPHGGIAFGLDRLIMLFAKENSIRDIMAFPKTTSGLSLMDNSPSKVNDEQLRDLHIKLRR
ncbi:MAG: aspartate--tRNA ligase [Melioribacteraceae bacterium]|nr:aspartate--tRNA ligase [Melioribacteraceae bacterium]